MKIAVLIKPTLSGEISPFDGAALECALRLEGADVCLVAMAPESAKDLLLRCTRLGTKKAYLLSDKAFAGSDTLATSYVLSAFLKRLSPDLIFCGRQSMEGDTGQVGIGISERLGVPYFGGVMAFRSCGADCIYVTTRNGMENIVSSPALLTFERIAELRLPSFFSVPGEVEILNADALGIDPRKCGQRGSPTRVVSARAAEEGKRNCKMILPSDFRTVLEECLKVPPLFPLEATPTGEKLNGKVFVYGEKALSLAKTISDAPIPLPFEGAAEAADRIKSDNPGAVIFDDSPRGKELAGRLAVMLGTGLCADCTELSVREGRLVMTRPAFAGDRIARIVCDTSPAMATVRTESTSGELVFGVGMGARDCLPDISPFAKALGGTLGASRAAVEAGLMPYPAQVGLTGRNIAPKVYVALGISGAVHHLAGIRKAGKIIAVNTDKEAPIFEYADFGIVCDVREILK